ncbi:MAG: restriction endonuclease subunit M [Bdellovibrionales bacterium GWA2_49_15]|nr:MAG: restriction endonuclease subunit M [Bdellovibrionales bacterium GWA2_49_15]
MTKQEQIEEQQFFKELEDKLWTSADRLRSSLDAAVYKHIVLGLVFIKYVSDAFDERREELKAMFKNPKHDYFLGSDIDNDVIDGELEIRDYYSEKNIFWVPEKARWENLKKFCRLSNGTALPWEERKNEKAKFAGVDDLLDKAMIAIEDDNPKLKNILNKDYRRVHLDDANMASLIDLVSTIPFNHKTLKSKDILGHVYEYFLGKFAAAEGQRGGQYYTPKSIVTLVVEMLSPYKGRVFDPAMGSGGFFISSEKFITAHGGRKGDIAVYGQESNPTTWRLAAMNMVLRGIDFDFGKEPADSFTKDQHQDLRADFVMANPPFNMKEWWKASLEGDVRWKDFPTPPQGNANFAWILHMLHHLKPKGSMALLLANGSMSSNTGNEGDIRKALIEKDLVECMVALPGQLFTNTQIPACIWFLTKDKKKNDKFRDRQKEFLFIDARKKGHMVDRVLRTFTSDDIADIAKVFNAWRVGDGYKDLLGFCKSEKSCEIEKSGWVLTPGRYVGAEETSEENGLYTDKIASLSLELNQQFSKSVLLQEEILKVLNGFKND